MITTKKLRILQFSECSDIDEFIHIWSKLYYYPSKIDYKGLIGKQELDSKNLKELFKWKNGMNLSDAKMKSFNKKIIIHFDWLKDNYRSKELDTTVFREKFSSLSTVWKIFLLHIMDHKRFPIYDQHVHRAYCFMKGETFDRISSSYPSNPKKESFYFETYLAFVEELEVKNLKKMDDAFFAFGQFLNTRNYSKLLSK